MNPQLAVDWRKAKLRFPLVQQPKIDGVRGLYMTSMFTGRSLKPFDNLALTAFWSERRFKGLDGELVAPDLGWTDEALCRTTTSIVNTIESKVIPDLVAFDLVLPDTLDMRYEARYQALLRTVRSRGEEKLYIMPYTLVRNLDDVEALDSQYLSKGFEGSILRDPRAKFKEGRSGNAIELWRIKRFIDFEFLIDELIEAMRNDNEAKKNELGHTERSSHKANKVPKGMIGSFRGRLLKDVVWNGRIILREGTSVEVGAGKMTERERIDGWNDQRRYLGKVGKAKMFPHGVMNKPRMPVFLSLRSKADL